MPKLDRPVAPDPYEHLPEVPSFTLESDDLEDGQPVHDRHAHASVGGDDVTPHLRWSGFPEETRSFAITVFDPDAPTHSGFWHWALVNLPASVTELPRGADLPAGVVEVRNDFGALGYGGPAPPQGDRPHRYVFAVHALDVDAIDGVTEESSPAFVGFNLTFHTLARGVIRGTYQVS
jgi:Raf kinase inhibitor-like YbhB/YbcL family protein